MCGIAGVVSKNPNEVTIDRLKRMTNIIHYRGPNGDGHWLDSSKTVGLGHRRLSIIDLSHEADQPMHYLDRYSIVFNGEIYNYIELKEVLLKQGYVFKTSSDTEVLMALYDRDSENCLQILDGMFSFAIYDSKKKEIFAARDRFGEKPFFYNYEPGRLFIFGSEMKVLWAAGVNKKVKNNMLYNYLSFGSLQNRGDLSETFFENIIRLPHAHYLIVDTEKITIKLKEYWRINTNEINDSIKPEQAFRKFNELFYTSVKRRLRSDVAVGSSLSGGLDSSLIVCVIDQLLNKNKFTHSLCQKTFSARFPGFERDEGNYMDMVAAATNVEPSFVYPTDDNILEDIQKVAYYQEEPFGGASILVQYEVMKLAKEKGVTVLLDGQGADEMLGGYHRYFNTFFRELEIQKNGNLKEEHSAYLDLHKNNTVNARQKKNLEHYIRRWMPGEMALLKKTHALINQKINQPFNKDFFANYSDSLFPVNSSFNSLNETLYDNTMAGDLQVLLRFADRNSMANSREVRLPFLSHEIAEFLFSLPSTYKIHNGWTKWIMRESFQSILPAPICWRLDKIGYEPPQKKWMENTVVMEKIIESRKTLVSAGILNKSILGKKPKANSAREKGDKSWEHLMAANLLTPTL
jgi:asparagine synthase (glutamine-hydrolysing)